MEKYPLAMRVMHWLIALLIIGLLIVGFVMANLPKGSPYHGQLVGLHKSFGLTVIMLAVLRVGIRLFSAVPPLPAVIPAVQRVFAHLGHLGLYGFMFLLPLSGYLMSASYGLPVKWFGVAVPRLVSVDKDRGELAWDFHYYGAWLLVGLLAAHVGAVALHYARERVNLIKRMW